DFGRSSHSAPSTCCDSCQSGTVTVRRGHQPALLYLHLGLQPCSHVRRWSAHSTLITPSSRSTASRIRPRHSPCLIPVSSPSAHRGPYGSFATDLSSVIAWSTVSA